MCLNIGMLDKWNEFWAKHSPSGLMIWNFIVFVPVILLIADGVKKGGGDGSFANVFLLMALAPTAIVLFLIDVYVLYKHFTKR